MNRFWSLLFLAVPIMGVAIVLGAANQIGLTDRWLPESIGPRTEGIDYLFEMIHIILGGVFMLTGLVLAFSLWKFRADARDRASYFQKSLPLEFLWTSIPAGILIFLAMHQLPFWQANKEKHPLSQIANDSNDDVRLQAVARVEAHQFGWRFVYPGNDKQFDSPDDLISETELVLPVDEELVLELISEDVIHSFAINQLRLKQDIVPGLRPRVWFRISCTGEWEINCMEFCGGGHYRMVAKLRVISRVEFDAWKEALAKIQPGF